MIDHRRCYRWQVDDLAADLADQLGVGQVRPATSTAGWLMPDCHLGGSPLQIRARRPGLFTLRPLRRPRFGPPLGAGLSRSDGISGRRFGRRYRVLLQLRLQRGDTISQRQVLCSQGLIVGSQDFVIATQLLNDRKGLAYLLFQ
jgi:hypothetical protein